MLAYSGGGDSSALLHLLADLAGTQSRSLHALIVDHGLRAQSRSEAELAAARAEALGAEARILSADIARATQAGARTARHRLLAAACHELGAQTLFLGHTRDDVIETVLMRLARDGSGRRLAVMGARDPSPLWPEGRGLILARPLIDVSRTALRAFLRERGADWIEDPSNTDRQHERVRVRSAAPQADTLAGDALARFAAAAASSALTGGGCPLAMASRVLPGAELRSIDAPYSPCRALWRAGSWNGPCSPFPARPISLARAGLER